MQYPLKDFQDFSMPENQSFKFHDFSRFLMIARTLEVAWRPVIFQFTSREYMWHDQGEQVGCQEYWFWVISWKRWQIIMFFIVWELQRITYISATRCLIEVGFRSKCSIFNGQVVYFIEIKIEYCRHVTLSPWSCHKCDTIK